MFSGWLAATVVDVTAAALPAAEDGAPLPAGHCGDPWWGGGDVESRMAWLLIRWNKL